MNKKIINHIDNKFAIDQTVSGTTGVTSLASKRVEDSVSKQNGKQDTKEVLTLKLSDIHLTDDYHFREQDDKETIDRYADIFRQYIEDKAKDESIQYPFPPIYVFYDGHRYIVVAGRHRYQAAKKIGLEKIPCFVLSDRAKAIEVGLSSNSRHGLPLRSGDMARCIRMAIKEFPEWSNRRIADLIGCSAMRVGQIVNKEQLRPSSQTTVTGKDGSRQPIQKNRSKGIFSADKAKSMLGAKENNQLEKKPDTFSQAIIDGVYTGKAFRKKVGELSKFVEQCTITETVVDYVTACTIHESLKNIVASLHELSRDFPLKDIEKKIASLKAEKAKLENEIKNVLIFGRKIYHDWLESLRKNVASDEEKSLLNKVEGQFEDAWKQVQDDLKLSENTSYKILKITPTPAPVKKYLESAGFTLGTEE